MKVLFTPTGREQFLGALAYIRRDNPDAAKAFRLKAEKVLKRLATFRIRALSSRVSRSAISRSHSQPISILLSRHKVSRVGSCGLAFSSIA